MHGMTTNIQGALTGSEQVHAHLRRATSNLSQTLHLYDLLWQGEDLSDYDHNLILMGHNVQKNVGSTPAVAVLGMFGSGTNLMTLLLQQTFGNHIVRQEGACKNVNIKKTRSQITCPKFWKHTHPLRVEDFDVSTPYHLVLMVRNPLPQMESWRRTPFNLHSCTAIWKQCSCAESCDGVHCGVEDPNVFPCGNVATDHVGNLSLNFDPAYIDRRPSNSKNAPYLSLMEVWNSYVGGYLRLASTHLPVSVQIVRYEDVVLDPVAEVKKLAKATNMEVPNKVSLVTDNARSFDASSVGRKKALARIKSKEYRKHMPAINLQKMCDQLSPSLLTKLSYEDECA